MSEVLCCAVADAHEKIEAVKKEPWFVILSD